MSSDEGIRSYISTIGTTLSFAPNSAVNSVPVALSAAAPLHNPVGNTYFQRGETFKLLSLFIAVPYQWGLAALGPLEMSFFWEDKLFNGGPMSEVFGIGGTIYVPDVNILFPLNVIVDTPNNGGPGGPQDAWRMEVFSVAGWAMNMVNSPVALDTIVQYPRVILYVQHNFNMVA